MKKDFRVQYPLWQIGFMFVFILIAIVYTGVLSDFGKHTLTAYSMELEAIEGLIIFLIIPIFLILFVAFYSKISKYNKDHPKNKFSIWSNKPFEFMEDDEAWQMITREATQKVYTFYSWSLPLSAFVHLFLPTSSLIIILNIVILSLLQYLIFYFHVRRHVMDDVE